MNIYLVVTLIIFIIWYLRHRYSDSASAIESFQSADSVTEDATQKQEAVRKSEKDKII